LPNVSPRREASAKPPAPPPTITTRYSEDSWTALLSGMLA
jgi:hypothetical protein